MTAVARPRPSARPRRLRSVACAWLAAAGACTSVVRPPAEPIVEPVAVLVSFDARHRGLLLPRGDDAWVEYGYGEYAWYAELRDAWYRAFPAVLWPTRGTLGRREIAARGVAGLRAAMPWTVLEELAVERARAAELLATLDARFERGRAELVDNRVYGMQFVPDDDGYWCCFNCNDALAGWLRQLGCRVSWALVRTDLAVAHR